MTCCLSVPGVVREDTGHVYLSWGALVWLEIQQTRGYLHWVHAENVPPVIHRGDYAPTCIGIH